MPYKSSDQQRLYNRAWHYRSTDGQCEAAVPGRIRCRNRGQYDGLNGRVLCGTHLRKCDYHDGDILFYDQVVAQEAGPA